MTPGQEITQWIDENCADCLEKMETLTGARILEQGEEALVGRAWLTRNAQQSIDVQYFIWSTDNVGTLAAEQLLTAAERGVDVRVLVDDLLIDAQGQSILLLSHKNCSEFSEYDPTKIHIRPNDDKPRAHCHQRVQYQCEHE